MNIDSPADIWNLVCEEIKKRIPDISYHVWISDLQPVEMRPGEFVLSVGSSYKKSIVESNYTDVLKDSFKAVMGLDIKPVIFSKEEQARSAARTDDSFEAGFTFENFIVGSTNRFAHAASMAVADNPAHPYNPLVIYGRSGVGKTHLLLAIKNRIRQNFPEQRVEYTRCEEFVNLLISSVHEGNLGMTADEFRDRYRNADVLLVDDIQFIAGKASTQEEFFNTFNALYQQQKLIVMTCDRPPKEIKSLDDRLRTRFEGGLIADIVPPDFETKVGILKAKAKQLNFSLPDNILYFVAEQIQDNTRQLEGVVKKIHALFTINGKMPSVATVQTLIKDVVTDTSPEPILVEQIISEVARTYNVSEEDIISTRRPADVVKARQAAMYIARETTTLPYNAIGEAFGRNHTTVLYAEKEIKKLMATNPREKTIIEDIIKNLKSL